MKSVINYSSSELALQLTLPCVFTPFYVKKPALKYANGMVTPDQTKPDEIVPDGARPKNGLVGLVLFGFLHQKFAGNLSQVGQIVPDNTRFCPFLETQGNFGV